MLVCFSSSCPLVDNETNVNNNQKDQNDNQKSKKAIMVQKRRKNIINNNDITSTTTTTTTTNTTTGRYSKRNINQIGSHQYTSTSIAEFVKDTFKTLLLLLSMHFLLFILLPLLLRNHSTSSPSTTTLTTTTSSRDTTRTIPTKLLPSSSSRSFLVVEAFTYISVPSKRYFHHSYHGGKISSSSLLFFQRSTTFVAPIHRPTIEKKKLAFNHHQISTFLSSSSFSSSSTEITTTNATSTPSTPSFPSSPKTYNNIKKNNHDVVTAKWTNEELKQKIKGITTIASDVDGTLLSSNHTLSLITKTILEKVIRHVSNNNNNNQNDDKSTTSTSSTTPKLQHFFLATGKSRKGALDSLLSRHCNNDKDNDEHEHDEQQQQQQLRQLLQDLPGVFLQGLYCIDGKTNTVIFEQKLPIQAVQVSEQLAKEWNTTIIANCGDVIYSNIHGHEKQLNEVNALWGEPIPIIVESLLSTSLTFATSIDNINNNNNNHMTQQEQTNKNEKQDDIMADTTTTTTTTTTIAATESNPNTTSIFHKIVFMHDDVEMLQNRLRPALEVLALENDATVTSSYPTIVEVLPKGCSKALGVRMVCERLLGMTTTTTTTMPNEDDVNNNNNNNINNDNDDNCISTRLLALGDAENDREMLEMAAIGVAMGNASPIAKAAADIIMKETSDEGAAGLAMERYSPLSLLLS